MNNDHYQVVRKAIFATPDEHLQSRDILIHNICAALDAAQSANVTDRILNMAREMVESHRQHHPEYMVANALLSLCRCDTGSKAEAAISRQLQRDANDFQSMLAEASSDAAQPYQSPFACMNDCAQGTCRNRTTGCQHKCEVREEHERQSSAIFAASSAAPAQQTSLEELLPDVQMQTDGMLHVEPFDEPAQQDPDNTKVICPECTHQFRAIPVQVQQKLRHAIEHIRAMPHGDNCFVSNHYEGDPGSRCNCGKDSILEWLEGDEAAPAQEAAPMSEREIAKRIVAFANDDTVPKLTDTGIIDILQARGWTLGADVPLRDLAHVFYAEGCLAQRRILAGSAKNGEGA